MKKPAKPTSARPTTTVRIYQDSHHGLWEYAGKQRPRPKLQDLLEEAVNGFLALKKRGA